jgi:hypothetical protein
MRPITDLLEASQFSTGLLVGFLALVVALPMALGLSALFPRRGHRPGVAGPAFAVAVVLALRGALGTDPIAAVPSDVVTGLVLLWLAGTIASRTPAPGLIGPVAALPGAIVLAGANDGLAAGWVPLLIAAGTVVIGATAADFDRRTGRFGLGPLLLFVSVGGIYATVPDTELMRAVVGVALALVFLAWPYAAASLGAGGAYAAAGLLLWIAPIEGIGRAGSIVGAAGAFALLVGEPLGRLLARELEGRTRLHRYPIGRPRSTLLVAQVLLVLYATRVAGMAQTASSALILLVPGFVASVAFGVLLVMPERRKHRTDASAPTGKPSPTRVQPRPPSNGDGRRRRFKPDDYV